MGQHDGLLLSGSPPILYINIYIHMNIFMTNKLCCCTRVVAYRLGHRQGRCSVVSI